MTESYIVEVKRSVFTDTSLTRADIDAVSNLSLSDEEFNDQQIIEFSSQEAAKEWVESYDLDISLYRSGRLQLRRAHADDESDVDAYVLFMPYK